MKKTILILFLTIFCFANPLFSQSKTSYEKKVDQIMIEMFKAIGIKSSIIEIAKAADNWDIVKTSQDFAFKTKLLEKEELLVIIIATDKRLKDAKQLKTDEDFNRDRDKEDEITLQKEIELRENLARFSDISKIKLEIKSTFSKWINKDEFETELTYQNRISEKGKVLDSIVLESIEKRIKRLDPNDCNNYEDSPYYLELIKYDADKKNYYINLVCRAYTGIPSYGTYQGITDRIKDTLNIDVPTAKLIKQLSTTERFNSRSDVEIVWFCNNEITTSYELNEWMITTNGYFIPKSYTLFKQYKHTSNDNLTQLNKMTIKASELGLMDFFSDDHIINIENTWMNQQSE